MMTEKGYTNIFNWDVKSGSYIFKHLLGGMFIAIAMTGLDQEMMQKNISVRTLKGSQKNVIVFSIVLVFINLLFLSLGVLLYLYKDTMGITFAGKTTDDLFPTIALNNLG